MALGIRVVLLDGSPIGWGPALVRNLLRIVAGTVVISRATQPVPSSAPLAS